MALRAFVALAVISALTALVTAAGRTEQVAGWTVVAARSDAGAPVCYTARDGAPGDRLILVLSHAGLQVVVRREAWRLAGERRRARVAIDDGAARELEAQVDTRALVFAWPLEGPAFEALGDGAVLEIVPAGASPARLSLDGAAHALRALFDCYAEHRGADTAGPSDALIEPSPDRRDKESASPARGRAT